MDCFGEILGKLAGAPVEYARVSKTKGRILVIRGGDIAEFILTCPAFAALRQQFPETSLEVLGYPRIAQLAKSAGLVDEVHSIESRQLAVFFARGGVIDMDWATFFARFQIIFSYLYDPDGIFQANVCKISQAQFIVGPARPKEGEKIHASDVFLKPLEKLAIFGAPSVPQLRMPQLNGSEGGSWIAIHPGREDTDKNWHESKWRALLMALVEKTSYRILLISADADARSLERISKTIPASRIEILKDLALPELASRVAQCQAFIGGDSGVLQLAASLGIHCIALWGTSNAAIWRPPGANVTLLHNRAGVNAITQDEVLAALPMVWTGSE